MDVTSMAKRAPKKKATKKKPISDGGHSCPCEEFSG